jgi:death-on-curing protein
LRDEPVWVPAEEIIATNRDVVAATGEHHVLWDAGKLESALQRPVNRWLYDGEDDAVVLAVSLMLAIARSHAFEQGNKRTGFLAALFFLTANGFQVDIRGDDRAFLGRLIDAAVARRITDEELTEEFYSVVYPL